MATQETSRHSNFQVWVGCLSCYNEGRLTGRWVDGEDADSYEVCQLPDHEEWWVLDHEFGILFAGECSPTEATAVAALLEPLNNEDLEVLKAYIDSRGEEPDSAHEVERAISDAISKFAGVYESLADFAYEYADNAGLIQDGGWPFTCIDWEQAGQELAQDFNWTRWNGDIYVYYY